MPRQSILMFHNASEVALSSVRSCACKFYGQHSVRSFATKETKRKLGRVNLQRLLATVTIPETIAGRTSAPVPFRFLKWPFTQWQWYISKEKRQLTTTSEQTIFHFNFLWRAERLILQWMLGIKILIKQCEILKRNSRFGTNQQLFVLLISTQL